MPVSYIDVPHGISPAGKEKLVKRVFEAIHEGYPIPDTRVLIREWHPDSVDQDGEIDLQPMRPICALEVPPGLPVEKTVERIYAVISEACHLPKHDGTRAHCIPSTLSKRARLLCADGPVT
jgi:hypothetical protein